MAPVRVGMLGATGETGSAITKALLDDGSFDIIGLTRPASLDKPANKAYQDRGITIRAFNVDGSQEEQVAALSDLDVLISAIAPVELLKQIPLATAAKAAGIKRFIPCTYRTILPPIGAHMLRELDEQIMNHVKLIKLPYTVVDVGAWYQLQLPEVPSGRTSYLGMGWGNLIPGDGNMPNALTDLADIGRYVARVIVDDRTLNKYVFVYNELWTLNELYSCLEKISGEKIESRVYQTEAQLRAQIEQVPADTQDMAILAVKILAQYGLSSGIRGDNQPEYAKYLGYLTSKELYPDMKFTTFEEFAKGAVDGKAQVVYAELKAQFAAAAEARKSG